MSSKFVPVNKPTKTHGNGWWSREERTVVITKMALCMENTKDDFGQDVLGELRAYFRVKNWDTEKHGLIYTDRNWIRDFRKILLLMKFSKKVVDNVYYNEQGMQGYNYVSLYVDREFIKQWIKKKYPLSKMEYDTRWNISSHSKE